MSGFRQTLSIKRRAAGTLSNGIYSEGAVSSIAITASVQPAGSKELQALPEGRRASQAFRLYTSTELFTASVGGRNADRVTLFGSEFEVVAVDVWQNGIMPHYKVIVSRVAEGTNLA